MARVDLAITNPHHHWAMVEPVVQRLVAEGHRCRVVSFCEVRGADTPFGPIRDADAEAARVLPTNLRKQRGRASGEGARSGSRHLARSALWYGGLGPASWRNHRRGNPDAVVVPNDISFPMARYVSMVKRRSVPTVLLQEGIRFPVASNTHWRAYGSGGAEAIAAWGPSSRDYFVATAKAPPDRVHLTGSPRHDRVDREAYRDRAAALRAGLGGDGRVVALLTNPVDNLGLCTTDEKMRLVAGLAEALAALGSDVSLVVKPHAAEDPALYARVLARSALDGRSSVVTGELYPLIVAADAAVILGSTVGLEALLLGTPLGVVALGPGRFAFDYVDAGVAVPVPAETPEEAGAALRRLLAGAVPPARVEAYLDRHLACRSQAADRVADLVASVAGAR